MIACKKAAPLAALIRKLALNDAHALQAASVQATRSLTTNAMRELDASDDESNLDRRSDRRVSRRRVRDNDLPFFSGVFDPFNPTRSLTDVLNLIDNFTAAAGAPAAVSPANRRGWYAKEDEDGLQLRVDMPGLGKEHVKVSAEQNTLIIKGEGEKEDGDEDGVRRYSSRIDLPDGYKMNEIKAEMKNGVLKIVVPKAKEEERKDVFQVNIE